MGFLLIITHIASFIGGGIVWMVIRPWLIITKAKTKEGLTKLINKL